METLEIKSEQEKTEFFSQPQKRYLSSLHLTLENWGEIPYRKALQKQQARVQRIQKDQKSQGLPFSKEKYLIFCSHPPVVTLGRGTQKEHFTSWTGRGHRSGKGWKCYLPWSWASGGLSFARFETAL